MINLESDLEGLHSVNPHLVQPITEQQQHQPTFDDLVIEEDSETKSTFIQDESSQASQEDSLLMERYMNLEFVVTSLDDTMSTFYADELNTPELIEAKELNKYTNTTTHLSQSEGNPFNFPEIKREDEAIATAASPPGEGSVHITELNFNTGDLLASNSNAMIEDDLSSLDGDNNVLLSPNNFDIDDINLDEYDFLTDLNEAICNDMKSTINYNDMQNKCNITTTTDNQHPTATINANEQHNYALKLNIGKAGIVFDDVDVLQTPDVINTICSIEMEAGLCLQGKYVSPEHVKAELTGSPPSEFDVQDTIDIKVPTPEESLQDDSSVQSLQSPPPTEVSRKRRKKYDSDDEEYIPPSTSTRRPTASKRTRVLKDDSDDEVFDELYVPAMIPKRGRPSKPVSRASDSSESSKYREMRDKNNEASRRSRRKRRQQEMGIEQEKEELVMHNERLKVQVAELEKSVTTYRSNLMALLLNKK